VGDPPPLRHAVILMLKKTKLAGFPTFEGLPKASHAPDAICALEAAT